MNHELILIPDFGSQFMRRGAGSFCRTILLSLFLALSFSCSQNSGPDTNKQNKVALTTPIPELAIASDWRTFEMGPFKISGPADLKKKDVKGEDSEIYEYRNDEFSIGIEIGMYSADSGVHSVEHETGSIMIDGNSVKYTKSDLNKPAANAARNADGSRGKPVEKHLLIEVRFPKKAPWSVLTTHKRVQRRVPWRYFSPFESGTTSNIK